MLDVKTLMFCDFLIMVSLGSALLVYGARQKTYAGFALWTAGTLSLALGYLTLILRGPTASWTNIVLTNGSFAAGSLLRLDGIRRFKDGNRLDRGFYLTPVLLIGLQAFFSFGRESIAARTILISLFLALVCFAIALVVLRAGGLRNTVFLLFGVLHALYGLLLLLRAQQWLATPQTEIFVPFPWQLALFALATVLETGIGIIFIMLHGQRLETELLATSDNLRCALEELQKTMSEVKVLSGLLPICAQCKKIRDTKGTWHQLEIYIKKRSDVDFTHGLCPDCIRATMPKDIADQVLGRDRST